MAEKREVSEIAKDRNGDLQPLVDHCLDLYDQFKASSYRNAKLEEIKEARKVYDQKADPATYPWEGASNLILPLEQISIDNLEPRLVAGLVGKEPVVRFEMEGITEKDEPTTIIEDWFNSELQHVVKINDHATPIAHNLLLEGTVYPICDYDETEEVRRDFVYNEQGMPLVESIDLGKTEVEWQTEDTTETVFQGGKIDYVPWTDMFTADDADDWETAARIRVIRPTYAELMRLKGSLGYIDKNIGPHLIAERGSSKKSEEQQSPAQSVDDVTVTGKETIECLECRLSYVHRPEDVPEHEQTDFEEDKIVCLISKDSGVILRLVELLDLNFKNEDTIKRIRMFPEKGKALGSPLHSKMKSIQAGASDIFNLVVNTATICMIPWFLYSQKAGLKTDEAIYPGHGIQCDDPNEVVFPKFQSNPQYYIQFIELFITFWERIGSVGDLQLGRESQSKTTATEVMAVIQEGNVKHNYQARVLREEFLSVLRTLYDLYYQKMPMTKQFIHKGQSTQLPRIEMRRPYKFRLTGSTDIANKLIERKENEDLYGLLRQDPIIDPQKLAVDMLKSYNREEPESYINPAASMVLQALQDMPELPQVIEQYMQQKADVAEEVEQDTKERMEGGAGAG